MDIKKNEFLEENEKSLNHLNEKFDDKKVPEAGFTKKALQDAEGKEITKAIEEAGQGGGGGGTDLGNQFQPNKKSLDFLNAVVPSSESYVQTYFDTAKFKKVLSDTGLDMTTKLFDGSGSSLTFSFIIPNKGYVAGSGDPILQIQNIVYSFSFSRTGDPDQLVNLSQEISWSTPDDIDIPEADLPQDPTLNDVFDYLIENSVRLKASVYEEGTGVYPFGFNESYMVCNIPEFTSCMVYCGYGNDSQRFQESDASFIGYALLDNLIETITTGE